MLEDRNQRQPPAGGQLARSFIQIGRDVVSAFGSALAEGLQWVGEHQSEIEGFWDRTQDRERHSSWSYLLDRVDSGTGLSLRVGLEMHRTFPTATRARFDETVADLIRRGLVEPDLVATVLTAIEDAPLSASKKRQLSQGVQHIVAGDYDLAVPALIAPLEGLFWMTAQERGLIREDKNGKWIATDKTSQRGKPMRGIENLSRLDALGLDEHFGLFLRGVAYGGQGHPYRHGSAEDGWRVRALCLLVGLIGWLELAGLVDAHEVIRGGFERASEAEAEEQRRAAPGLVLASRPETPRFPSSRGGVRS